MEDRAYVDCTWFWICMDSKDISGRSELWFVHVCFGLVLFSYVKFIITKAKKASLRKTQ